MVALAPNTTFDVVMTRFNPASSQLDFSYIIFWTPFTYSQEIQENIFTISFDAVVNITDSSTTIPPHAECLSCQLGRILNPFFPSCCYPPRHGYRSGVDDPVFGRDLPRPISVAHAIAF